MLKSLSLIVILAFLGLSNHVFSQTDSDRPIKKIHYYTFSGTAVQEQLEQLQQDIASLEFVTQAKVEYKAEKLKGQVRILTSEPQSKNENDPLFSPYNVKQVFIKLGYTPEEYRFENQ